ncbi:MAG: J domain-containing protein [Oligoflexales bacterium]
MIDRIKKILRYQAYELQNRIWERQEPKRQASDEFFNSWNTNPPPNEETHQRDATQAPEDTLEREYYENLELPINASFDEIKLSYRNLIKKYHPDRYHSDPSKQVLAEQITAKLNAAYQYFESKKNQNKGNY